MIIEYSPGAFTSCISIYGEKAYIVTSSVALGHNLVAFSTSSDAKLTDWHAYGWTFDMPIYGLDDQVIISDLYEKKTINLMKQLLKNLRCKFEEEERFYVVPRNHIFSSFPSISNEEMLERLKSILISKERLANETCSFTTDWPYTTYNVNKIQPLALADFEEVISQAEKSDHSNEVFNPFMLMQRKSLSKMLLNSADTFTGASFTLLCWTLDGKMTEESMLSILNYIDSWPINFPNSMPKDEIMSKSLSWLKTSNADEYVSIVKKLREIDWVDPALILRRRQEYEKALWIK